MKIHNMKVATGAYWIARYPVTNAQYSEFVRAGGYREEQYWLEARAAKIWQNGKIHLDWAKEIKKRPSRLWQTFHPTQPSGGGDHMV